MTRLPGAVWGPGVTAAAALVPLVWLWGFTVDDALITGRVAHQLATGHGYRFNPGGPPVDAVTPLGFAYLLSPAAGPGPLAALAFAKWFGALAWLGAAAFLGRELGRIGPKGLGTGAVVLVACSPLAAWAASGMETGLVTALATLALARSNKAPLAAGIAAGLRPELGAWALVLVLGRSLVEPAGEGKKVCGVLRALGLGLGPMVLVAVVRSAVFGHAYPLSVVAKPSDLSHGAVYTVSALIHTGPAWLVLAGVATYTKITPRSKVIVLAALAHALALVLAGGDWMPLYRLMVPVLPGLILVGAELNQATVVRWPILLRVVAALAVSVNLAAGRGQSAANVGTQRALLIDGARPHLASARKVATLDVGWVGAATAAPVVDLAGVTDPSVARLPGGHTTKRLPLGFLDARHVDALVVLAERPKLVPLAELVVMRGVEARLSALDSATSFSPIAIIPLTGTTQGYVVYRRSLTPG